MPHEFSPSLPIKIAATSNGEFRPLPVSRLLRQAQDVVQQRLPEHARRQGQTRRAFLTSLCGAATTLLTLNEAFAYRDNTGGWYNVSPEATLDQAAAQHALGGDAAMLILALSGGQGCPSIPNELQWAIPLSKEVEMTSPLGFEDLQSILYQRIDPWPDHRKEGPNTNTVRHSFCR